MQQYLTKFKTHTNESLFWQILQSNLCCLNLSNLQSVEHVHHCATTPWHDQSIFWSKRAHAEIKLWWRSRSTPCRIWSKLHCRQCKLRCSSKKRRYITGSGVQMSTHAGNFEYHCGLRCGHKQTNTFDNFSSTKWTRLASPITITYSSYCRN